jgi:hypothetical protein
VRDHHGMPEVVASFINWPNNAWDELGTGLVTGAVTGLVAVGLFMAQRRSDRNHSRDLLTLAAIEEIRRSTFTLIDAVRKERGRERFDRVAHRAWHTEVSVQRSKVDSRNAQDLVSEAVHVMHDFAIRRREIGEAHPITDDGLGNVTYPEENVRLMEDLYRDVLDYLDGFNGQLSRWKPNRQKISKSMGPTRLLTEPYWPAED